MKFIILKVGFLFISFLLKAQYVPQRFVIETKKIADNFNDVRDQYKFYTSILEREDYDFHVKDEKQPNPFDDHHLKSTEYTYVYLLNSNKRDKTLILKIKRKEEVMSIYIRLNYILSEGEDVFLKDFEFRRGSYFFDTCISRKKFSLERKADFDYRIIDERSLISLKNLKKHKTTLKCIQRITKKYKCGQESPIKSNKL